MKLKTLGLIVGLSVVFGPAALAGETVITGPNGQQAAVQTTGSHSNGTTTLNRTTTYPNGQTTNSTGTFTGNGSGGYTGSVDRTNRQGQNQTYGVEGQITRGNQSRQNNAVITGSNGQQSTLNSNGSCSQGQCTGTRVLTYPNGQNRTTTVNGARNGQGTSSGTINVTGRQGRSRSGTFNRTR